MPWFNDITSLVRFEAPRFGVATGPNGDPLRVLAELAFLIREYESPGAGLAVPVSYLTGMVPPREKHPKRRR